MPRIMHLSDAATLAIHTMVMLACNPKTSRTVAEMAQAHGASESHLAKVMQRLTRVGLVHSTRGPKGGCRLACDPRTVTLLTVYEAIEGPLEKTECLLDKRVCSGESCVMGDMLHEMDKHVRGYLSRTHLSDLAHIYGPAPAAK